MATTAMTAQTAMPLPRATRGSMAALAEAAPPDDGGAMVLPF
jgi:hypothetical protein